ncbi:MAG: type II toxin-antitoxin system Phd/YefM family antitoxin [Phycisphaeraceae bacterium]
MVRATRTRTLADFRSNVDQTLDRLQKTGDAEVLTENGEDRAVVLSAKAFEELSTAARFAQTLATIQQAETEISEGQARPAEALLDELRAKLLKAKDKQR